MDNSKVNEIWNEAVTEASNRSKGSFKRALWYGTNTNKGARKAMRNAPKKIMLGSLDFAGIAPGLSTIISSAADAAMTAGKEHYSAHIKPLRKSKPTSSDEAVRKQVKNAVKDMKSNAFQVIDRNLVKLKDASKKVAPSIRDLMAAAPSTVYQAPLPGSNMPAGMGGSHNSEKQAQKAHEALRHIAETEYYIDKEMGLVKSLQQALVSLEKDLNTMQEKTQKTRKETMEYIELSMD
ncbi:hypothetical protein [Neptunomonas sp.]|uniref:hypothetical protein n=1 Tax=Neptunomonas sp. TaxID=1971898 RepID=UPI0025E6F414|nr:hypothetical protein [Neptunomonas sp.]